MSGTITGIHGIETEVSDDKFTFTVLAYQVPINLQEKGIVSHTV